MRYGSALSIALLALRAVAAEPGVSTDAILLGIEGPSNCFSLDEENLGFQLAIQHANEAGGIHGRKLATHSYSRNGCATVNDAVANAKRLVEEDRVFALLNFGGPASVTLASYAAE